MKDFQSGSFVPPDEEFAKLAAAVIGRGTRWQYLHSKQGHPTDAIFATATLTSIPDPKEAARLQSAHRTVARLAEIAPRLAKWRTGLTLFGDVWERRVSLESSPPSEDRQFAAAEAIWSSVLAPLAAVGLLPEHAPDAYFVAVFAALTAAIPANDREAPRAPGAATIAVGDIFSVVTAPSRGKAVR